MRKLRLEDVADPTSGLMKNCPVDLVSAVRLLASHAVDSPRRPGRVASAVTAQVRALVREAEHATRHRIDALDREIKSTALHSRAATSAAQLAASEAASRVDACLRDRDRALLLAADAAEKQSVVVAATTKNDDADRALDRVAALETVHARDGAETATGLRGLRQALQETAARHETDRALEEQRRRRSEARLDGLEQRFAKLLADERPAAAAPPRADPAIAALRRDLSAARLRMDDLERSAAAAGRTRPMSPASPSTSAGAVAALIVRLTALEDKVLGGSARGGADDALSNERLERLEAAAIETRAAAGRAEATAQAACAQVAAVSRRIGDLGATSRDGVAAAAAAAEKAKRRASAAARRVLDLQELLGEASREMLGRVDAVASSAADEVDNLARQQKAVVEEMADQQKDFEQLREAVESRGVDMAHALGQLHDVLRQVDEQEAAAAAVGIDDDPVRTTLDTLVRDRDQMRDGMTVSTPSVEDPVGATLRGMARGREGERGIGW